MFERHTIERAVDLQQRSYGLLTWTDDLREYVQTREGLVFHLEDRTFHICRSHPLARTVIETGVSAANFECPRAECPFAAASRCAGGRAVQLVARSVRRC